MYWGCVYAYFHLLMLVSAGLNSVIERTLLAWWQLRQAPTFSPVFGLSTFLMDDAKLLSKLSECWNSVLGMASFSVLCLLPLILWWFLFRSCWSALLFVHFTWLWLSKLNFFTIYGWRFTFAHLQSRLNAQLNWIVLFDFCLLSLLMSSWCTSSLSVISCLDFVIRRSPWIQFLDSVHLTGHSAWFWVLAQLLPHWP